MRKKALSLSLFTATTMVASPAFAQVDVPAEDAPETVTDIGTGDADVRLVTTVTGAVLPGQDAWVHFMWAGDAVMEAREFKVTAVGSEGVEIGYPADHLENVRDHSSLMESSVLPIGYVDFTALRLVVSPSAVDPQVALTVSYISDTGPVTETFVSTIEFDTSVYEGTALDLAGGPLGTINQGEAAWLQLDVRALHNASEIEVRVGEKSDFGIKYPNEMDYSSLSAGSRIVVDTEDYAAIEFDSLDLEPGVYTVPIEISYFVGLTPITQTFERTIEVVAPGNGDDENDGTDEGTDGTDDGDGTTQGTGSGGDGSDNGGEGSDNGGDGEGTDDGGEGPDDSGEGPDDGGEGTDDGGTEVTGPVTVGTLAQGVDGWKVNPYGTDTATTGVWGFGQPPVGIWNNLVLELGSTPSGNKGWFTLSGTGSEMGDHDIDGGETSVLSPMYSLPDVDDVRLDFDYYFSYLTNATADDSLRVVMITEDGNKVILNEQAKKNKNQEAKWESLSVNLSRYAGQDVQFLITAGDRGTLSYVEAAIDGFTITAE